MSKIGNFNIETQTEDNQIISIVHINEKLIALEISEDANRIFRNNLRLFKKINNSTKFISGKLIRKSVSKPRFRVNRSMVLINDAFDGEEQEIARLKFDRKNLKLTRSALVQGKKRVDYEPAKVKSSPNKNILNPDNITIDDLSQSKIICQVEELFIFQRQGVVSYMFTDNLSDRGNISEVSYELQLQADTDFTRYVDLVIRSLKESMVFLQRYHNGIEMGKTYNHQIGRFKESYVKEVMAQLGIDYDSKLVIDMRNNKINTSEFGKAAKNYYNALLLMKDVNNKKIYKNIINNLLPLKNNDPEIIGNVIKSFEKLYYQVVSEYGRSYLRNYNTRNRSNVGNKKSSKSTIIIKCREKYKVEQDKLGYNIFSVTNKGINRFTPSNYTSRFLGERTKYFQNIKAGPEINTLNPKERQDFLNQATAPSFLTPVSLVMGEETIDTSRGLRGINPTRIKEFKTLKSIKSKKIRSNAFNSPTDPSRATSNALGSFNISIAPPFGSLMTEKRDSVTESHTDVAEFVGATSFLISENPLILRRNLIKLGKKLGKVQFDIVSEIMPKRFLRPKLSLKSISDIKLSNPKSRSLGTISLPNFSFKKIPPHIKAMMLDNFSVGDRNSDPIKNPEASAVLSETQQNVFKIKALVGFGKDRNGFADVFKPVYRDMDSSVLNSGNPILAKAYDYEIPELGIVKDKLSTTIYNNLIYIRG